MNKLLISAAIIGVTALSSAESAQAYGTGTLKCFGVATAGQNDCKAYDGSHSCAGKAAVSYNANDWIYVETEEQCAAKCGHLGSPETPIGEGCNNGAASNGSDLNDMKTMPAPATGSSATDNAPINSAVVPLNNNAGRVMKLNPSADIISGRDD